MVAPTKSLDDVLDEIVTLAKIPKDFRPNFRSRVRDTISIAVPGIKKLRLSDQSIASPLKAITSKASALLASLRKIDVPEVAGLRLRAALIDQRRGVTIKHFIGELELLIKAANRRHGTPVRGQKNQGRELRPAVPSQHQDRAP